MTIPENVLIFLGIVLIVSLIANAAFVGLFVALINIKNTLEFEEKLNRK